MLALRDLQWRRRRFGIAIVGTALVFRADAPLRAVTTRLRAYNDALAGVCRGFDRCRFDGGAMYRYAFGKGDLSAVDDFHPSVTGQRRISEITWRAGYWA